MSADTIRRVRAHHVPTRDSGPARSVALISSVCLAGIYRLFVAQHVPVPEKTALTCGNAWQMLVRANIG